MSEEDKPRPRVSVGTIGHVDHGKTTLTAALQALAKKGLLSGPEVVVPEPDDYPLDPTATDLNKQPIPRTQFRDHVGKQKFNSKSLHKQRPTFRPKGRGR